MRTIRLVIAFDGSRYSGWQSQKKLSKKPTIQEIFEEKLQKLFGEKITLHGSSRTDSGVHAHGLVAHFKASKPIPDAVIARALNYHLPKDIGVRSAKTVPDNFHARFQAKSKIYEYRIWNHRVRPVFEAPFMLHVPQTLNIKDMRKAARYLVGKHDFSAFKDAKDELDSHVRTIKSLKISKSRTVVRIRIQADGFLTHMVRIIVGTLLDAGKGRIKPDTVREILKSRDRRRAGQTIPPQGLHLLRVIY